MNRFLSLILAVSLGLATAVSAQAQDAGARKVDGTLKKVDSSGTITLGYREASFPLSYESKSGPIGYAIDLCLAVVDEIKREIDKKEVKVNYKKVTSETRIPAVKSGEVDLECGSTTANRERSKEVAFSPITYVTGTKLMVKRASGIRSYRDLNGKVVVVTAGTTNETALKALNERLKLGINIITARDHEESYSLAAAGKADAFATDDVLLYGLIARHKAEKDLIVVGDFLSYDPYGLMFRKDDPQMAEAVRKAFEYIAANKDLYETYHKWFVRKTPTGETLGLPMNAQLTEIFRTFGAEE
ncbi:glutamate/aspartate periplasmic-binding protein precursor [Variibacter gotjawalensis]|uniref:Glutamate/aspartate periplasmic-binding protein n=1 Tax=Variibacter gotjawalensis TaxID=1333996 RepID=A0A0S3PQ69_9BRAD|nr:amino acid ABC transporter substrate-binding protein [Variibacter gotjawalensis]NIK48391.1 glutamate/aspartate transport system substrate-binding protein [Variibacter gotjawalensis]RZS50258.1 amino acid ABC transporter substrate-binding protein (PAAT family) [Variibacter gotjawalensis]BAT58091.1 glutamate/aspartate periplasmic-binding protein precursor [Variibacter gotjawalensis]